LHKVKTHTDFPTWILNNLEEFTGNELKVLCLIVKQTASKKSYNTNRFAAKYLQFKLGISRCTALSVAKSLIKKQAITVVKGGHGQVPEYEINYEQVQKLDQSTGLKIKNEHAQNLVQFPKKVKTSNTEQKQVQKLDPLIDKKSLWQLEGLTEKEYLKKNDIPF